MCDPSPGQAGPHHNIGFAKLKPRSRTKLGKIDLQRKLSSEAIELEVLYREKKISIWLPFRLRAIIERPGIFHRFICASVKVNGASY